MHSAIPLISTEMDIQFIYEAIRPSRTVELSIGVNSDVMALLQ